MGKSNIGRMFTWGSVNQLFVCITENEVILWRNNRFNVAEFQNRELVFWVEVV